MARSYASTLSRKHSRSREQFIHPSSAARMPMIHPFIRRTNSGSEFLQLSLLVSDFLTFDRSSSDLRTLRVRQDISFRRTGGSIETQRLEIFQAAPTATASIMIIRTLPLSPLAIKLRRHGSVIADRTFLTAPARPLLRLPGLAPENVNLVNRAALQRRPFGRALVQSFEFAEPGIAFDRQLVILHGLLQVACSPIAKHQ
jgi:hypothetical protein